MIEQRSLLIRALKYSFPVFLGYVAIGIAFGLFTVERGYPWYLALITGIIMFAGAGQFIAVGLFAAGASLAEAVLVEFMVNARHMAYGLSMIRRFRSAGFYRFYLIFALTDETFALLSSLPATSADDNSPDGYKSEQVRRVRFMFLVSLLNHIYWNTGILIGALAGSIIPWDFHGVGFALTALFIVLMIEQILRIRRPAPFVISAFTAVAAVFLLPGALSGRFSLLSAMIMSLGFVQLFETSRTRSRPC
ncbi:MAG: AzlC family ABC transporter permease [Treponema sp.]|jgi:4-azaleucine resistance transporter AzlC|nr:AzlC family ABC transporter permease [Treponema sp.]